MDYKSCKLCPRNCGVDRIAGVTGYCGETAKLRVAFTGLHKGEEPPLIGDNGSGTIFISGCNLRCAFCQNYQISQDDNINENSIGKAVSSQDFAGICLTLQERGAANVNIVTGSHAVPAIVDGLVTAKNAGLRIPVLWNSSAYENPSTLELLRDHIDVFLPDLKTLDCVIAAKFFNAPDYPTAAHKAILKMIEMVPALCVIIRHLILPGYLENTHQVLKWFADNVKGRAQFSLMTQYTPIHRQGISGIPDCYVSKDEYETVIGWLEKFNIDDGFCQELVTGSEWLPDFRRVNPFSSELSIPVYQPNLSAK